MSMNTFTKDISHKTSNVQRNTYSSTASIFSIIYKYIYLYSNIIINTKDK